MFLDISLIKIIYQVLPDIVKFRKFTTNFTTKYRIQKYAQEYAFIFERNENTEKKVNSKMCILQKSKYKKHPQN